MNDIQPSQTPDVDEVLKAISHPVRRDMLQC